MKNSLSFVHVASANLSIRRSSAVRSQSTPPRFFPASTGVLAMGLRFYRRVRIIPGLRVNLSGSGPSLSIGRLAQKARRSRTDTSASNRSEARDMLAADFPGDAPGLRVALLSEAHEHRSGITRRGLLVQGVRMPLPPPFDARQIEPRAARPREVRAPLA
jgi:Protein of unknown function (DUF4236)